MIYLRFQKDEASTPVYGWLDGDKIGAITGDLFGDHTRAGFVTKLAEVALLAPVQPSKIIAVGGNYEARVVEQNTSKSEIPVFFFKPPSAIIGTEAAIVLPPLSQQVEHQAELAVIIGRQARWVSVEDALHFVLGYTCANDVTARDLQQRDRWTSRGKSFDTFLPLGPWITTNVDAADLVITCSVNGQVRQMASTRDLIFSVPQLIAFISSIMTLQPGDVILTGTPPGVGTLEPGDLVAVDIEGIGTLRNSVAAAE